MENRDEECILSENADSSGDEQRKGFRWTNSIEFPIFLIMFGISLSGAAITNLIMYRTCLHSLGYSKADCAPFLKPGRANISQEIEAAVQQYATFVSMVKSVLESLLPALLSLFIIVWSDRYGRKPLLAWPMLGITLTGMSIVPYSMMESLGPWWYILTCAPYSLTGGFSILATAAICYVTDLTGEKYRSFRIMLIQATFAAGMAGGSLASPYLLSMVGSVYLLLTAAVLLALGYAFTAVCIEESIANAASGSLSTVLDPHLVTEMCRECFKRRPNRLRAQLLLLTTVNSLSTFTAYGVLGLGYLYTRKTLHWGLKDYTQFSAVSTAISFFGSIFGVAVIQRFLPISDLAFSTFACLTTAVDFYIRGFANASWQMYLATSISTFGDLSSALIRSLISKSIPAEDVAKVFALMCAVEGLCPVLAPIVYNALYAATVTTFPGAVMMVTSNVNAVCVLLLGVVAYFRWRSGSLNYAVLEQEVDT